MSTKTTKSKKRRQREETPTSPAAVVTGQQEQPLIPVGGRYNGGALLPESIREGFIASAGDANQLDVAAEIALADAMIRKATEALASGSDAPFSDRERKELVSAVNFLVAAKARRDHVRMQDAIRRLQELAKPAGDLLGWSKDLREWMELRRRFVDTRAKMLKDIGAMMPVEKVNVMVGFIVALVGQRVEDKEIALGLIRDILKIAGHSDHALGAEGLPQPAHTSSSSDNNDNDG